tara:strand:+ start:1371 stop:1568 length:198 start_codon:yes stop_codon:yes gene_type:complete
MGITKKEYKLVLDYYDQNSSDKNIKSIGDEFINQYLCTPIIGKNINPPETPIYKKKTLKNRRKLK